MMVAIMAEYWRGRFGYVGAMTTDDSRAAVMEALDQDVPVLDAAPLAHGKRPDVGTLEGRMCVATSYLLGAMALATGYLDAGDTAAPRAFLALWNQAVSLGVAGIWSEVGKACRDFARKDGWRSAADLMAVAKVAQDFLAQRGLTYGQREDDAVAFEPPARAALH